MAQVSRVFGTVDAFEIGKVGLRLDRDYLRDFGTNGYQPQNSVSTESPFPEKRCPTKNAVHDVFLI